MFTRGYRQQKLECGFYRMIKHHKPSTIEVYYWLAPGNRIMFSLIHKWLVNGIVYGIGCATVCSILSGQFQFRMVQKTIYDLAQPSLTTFIFHLLPPTYSPLPHPTHLDFLGSASESPRGNKATNVDKTMSSTSHLGIVYYHL